jgi:hypothetical protein
MGRCKLNLLERLPRAVALVAHDLVRNSHTAGVGVCHLKTGKSQLFARKPESAKVERDLARDDVSLLEHLHAVAGPDLRGA